MEHEVGSPDWWRDKLHAELLVRRVEVQRLERYYSGDHPLPKPPERLQPAAYNEARRAFMAMARMGVTNWVKLVADAPAERLEPVGYRSKLGRDAEEAAWRRWQASDLDAQAPLCHDNALQTGQSFVLVDPTSADITIEHSGQMIVAYQPGSRRVVAAALKAWDGDSGDTNATLFLPNSVHKWRSSDAGVNWADRDEVTEHTLDAVTVTEFAANPTAKPHLFGGGVSEYASVLSIQDRINKTVFDRLVTAEYQAFRQRWIVGWSPELDPDTKLPRAEQVQKAAQATLWTFDADPADVKLGEFGQAEFAQFIKATEADVNAMAAISKTPPHYLLGAMVNISGEALTAAESGLSAKTRKHARNFGAKWEQVMRHAALVEGDADTAGDVEGEIVWGDIEHRSWGEQVDAVLKMGALGVPTEALWERLPDVTPQDVIRWRGMRVVDSLLSEPPTEVNDDATDADSAA